MTSITKKIRHFYWFFKIFLQKNFKILIISFIASLLFIFLTINFFPFINELLFKKRDKIGVVGQYTLTTLPNDITSLMSNSLISINNKGEILPVLASSWEIKDKNTTYIFHLKKNLVWSDGKKFVAADINYKFKGIQTIVLNENTIEFKLSHQLSIFPVYLTKPLIRSPLKGIAGLYQPENFRLEKGIVQSVSLSPNKSELSYKTYYFYDTEDKLITAYKKGEINSFHTQKKSITDTFKNWKNTTIDKSVNYNQIMTLFFNNTTQVLSNKDIRQALAYDSPSLEDMGERANGPIPPFSWAYDPNLKEYSYNIDKAKSLVKKELNSSSSAQLNLYTFYDYIDVAEQLKKNFDQIGLKTIINVVSYTPQNFDMFLTLWNPPLDPDQYYLWHSTQSEGNITNYKSDKIDKLLEDGRSITDITQRKEIYSEFQKKIVEDVPAFFIYYPYIYTVTKK